MANPVQLSPKALVEEVKDSESKEDNAWERYPAIAKEWEEHPLSPEDYRKLLSEDDGRYKLSRRRAAFFYNLARLPGIPTDGTASLLMVAAGTGEQLSQIPGPQAREGRGFGTLYFTDGALGSVELALGLMREILKNKGQLLEFEEFAHPTLSLSNEEGDKRPAQCFKVTGYKGDAPDPRPNYGPETWVGATFVFAQVWSSELKKRFSGFTVDIVADVWGLCSFRDALGFAKDLKNFRESAGARFVAFLEHGFVEGSGKIKEEFREKQFERVGCDCARDMETIVGKDTCEGDYALCVFRDLKQFFWFLHPSTGLAQREDVVFVPQI